MHGCRPFIPFSTNIARSISYVLSDSFSPTNARLNMRGELLASIGRDFALQFRERLNHKRGGLPGGCVSGKVNLVSARLYLSEEIQCKTLTSRRIGCMSMLSVIGRSVNQTQAANAAIRFARHRRPTPGTRLSAGRAHRPPPGARIEVLTQVAALSLSARREAKPTPPLANKRGRNGDLRQSPDWSWRNWEEWGRWC